MNIYPVDNNISMQGKCPNWLKNFKQKAFDLLPGATSKENANSVKKWDKINHFVSDPMWNRGIMGATALVTQPTIDYYNHRVDDETRTVSRNRTISKIVAGTLVGMFVVRGPIYKMVEKMTNVEGTGKYSKALLPKKYIKQLSEDTNTLKNYRSSIAMALALGAMCFTNFLLDAPLTILFTNMLNKKSGIKEHDIKNNPETEVNADKTEMEAKYA